MFFQVVFFFYFCKMTTKNLLLLMFMGLLGYMNLTAQAVKLKWGKASVLEKNMKICAFDSLAEAVILFDKGDITIRGTNVYIERHKRLKILDERAIDEYGQISLAYFAKKDTEKIINVKVQTINYKDGKPIVSKLASNEIFDKKSGDWGEVTFAFPKVEKGSILEFKYTLVSSDLVFLDPWVFQNDLPTVYSEVSAVIPPSLQYSVLFFGKMLQTKYQAEVLEDQWSLENIPGYKDEKYVFNYLDYADRLVFQLKSYTTLKDQYSYETQKETLLNSWERLATEVEQRYKKFATQKVVREALGNIGYEGNPTEENLSKIYDQIVQNYQWDRKYHLFARKKFSKVVEDKKGTSAEINLFLLELLQEAGYEAYPMLLSTRRHGRVTKDYPLLSQFNNVIVAVYIDNRYLYLDAALASNFNNYKILPLPDFNFYGYMLDGKDSKWLKILEPKISSVYSKIELDLGKIAPSYIVEYRFNNYFALSKREEITTSPKDIFHPKEKKVGNILFEFDSQEIKGLENNQKPLELKYNFKKIEGELKSDIVYLSVDFLKLFEKNPFLKNQRYMPIELDFPVLEKNTVEIVLPDTYKIESVPENVAIKLPEGYGKFYYTANQYEHKIIITTHFELKKTVMPAAVYPYLKRIIDRLIAKYQEPIVLKKH